MKAVERDGFRVEATEHTLANTSIPTWKPGQKLNLERALKVGDRLGGHIVQGHIDAVGRVTRVQYGSGSTVIHLDIPPAVNRLLTGRCSVALDGVSLTVAEKTHRGFKVMVIPYTLEHTALGDLKPGGEVNIETDIIIRWLAERFPEERVRFQPGDPPDGHLED